MEHWKNIKVIGSIISMVILIVIQQRGYVSDMGVKIISNAYPVCKPEMNIFFLKTAKTGSQTTMTPFFIRC